MSRREHLLRLVRGLTVRGEELHTAMLREIRGRGPASDRAEALRCELYDTRRARAEMLVAVEALDSETLDRETAP